MRPGTAYTSARILLFVAALALLYLVGARGLLLVALALLASGIISSCCCPGNGTPCRPHCQPAPRRDRTRIAGVRRPDRRGRQGRGPRPTLSRRRPCGPPSPRCAPPRAVRARARPGQPSGACQPAAGGEQLQHRADRLLAGQGERVDDQVGVGRLLVRVRHPGQPLDEPSPCPGVQALPVPRGADVDRRGHVHEQEVTGLGDDLADPGPGPLVGGDGRADGDAAVPRDLGRDVADPRDVQVTVGARERQPGRQQPAHLVPVEQRHASRSPRSASSSRRSRAMVDLPEPDSPVMNTTRPRSCRGGLARRSSRATASGVCQDGSGSPAVQQARRAPRHSGRRARLPARSARSGRHTSAAGS